MGNENLKSNIREKVQKIKIKHEEKEKEKEKNNYNNRKKVDNRILKRNIKKSDLTTEELEILECLSKPEKAYRCGYCPGFPLISFSVVKDPRVGISRNMIELILLDHNWDKKKGQYISHRFRDDQLNSALNKGSFSYIEESSMKYIFKEKYKENKSENLLPFENLDEFHEFLKVVIKYRDLKKKISLYNFGKTEKNYVFAFFEYLLNMGLYGFGTLYEYLNALSISNFLEFEILEQYNCGVKMKSGDFIFETGKSVLSLTQVINIIKVNNNNLCAFITTNYKSGQYKNPICGIFLIKLDANSSYIGSNDYLKYKESDPPKKEIILKQQDKNYKDIIELETDKYLLLIDDNNLNGNLIIASYIENSNKYNYKSYNDIRCLSFLKLKSNDIFLLGDSNIYLMHYNEKEKELKEIKKYPIKISINNNNYNYNFLCYELLNGDIIFSIDINKFCYFNMKTFMLQASFECKNLVSPIIRFSQLRDKNYLYFGINKSGFELNLNNGKIKEIKFGSSDKSKYTSFNKYYLFCDKCIKVKSDNNETLFSKSLDDEGKSLVINEKEGLFAGLCFLKHKYMMNLYIFKIDKNND